MICQNVQHYQFLNVSQVSVSEIWSKNELKYKFNPMKNLKTYNMG